MASLTSQEILNSRTLTSRYGVTLRTIDRWLERAGLEFPQPCLVVGKRRYWRLADIEAWETSQAAAAARGKVAA